MDYLSRLFNAPPDRDLTYVVGATVVATFAVMTVTRLALQGKQDKIIRSPSVTLLPKLSEAEKSALPYPPDVLPGGRDVESPYGTAKVYEWGPEQGRKVLLVHGITTPCISLGSIGHGLVEKGCRVMLLDLWGRGYSDSVADLEHDERLYSTEILIALTSSPLSWTGGPDGGFSLIGYSMGGGIAASFASWFPHMVKSLILFAPAGLIRPQHMSGRSRFLYSMGIVPESLLKWGVTRRLKAGPMYRDENQKPGVRDAVGAEVEGNAATTTTPPLSKTRPDVTVEQAVQWQLDAHKGFVHSFMSSVRFSPVTSRHEEWARLSLRKDKILIFTGATDPIIIPGELQPDVEALLGTDKIDFRIVQGAHDFPITSPTLLVGEICKFWGM